MKQLFSKGISRTLCFNVVKFSEVVILTLTIILLVTLTLI
jgi:hypothetical protein